MHKCAYICIYIYPAKSIFVVVVYKIWFQCWSLCLGQLLVLLSKAILICVIRTGCHCMPAYILVLIVMSPKLVTLNSLLWGIFVINILSLVKSSKLIVHFLNGILKYWVLELYFSLDIWALCKIFNLKILYLIMHKYIDFNSLNKADL